MTATYGADALRLYEMFVAPPEKEIEWTDAGLEGSARFLGRVWRLVTPFAPAFAAGAGGDVGAGSAAPAPRLGEAERALRRKTHETIRRVSDDLDPRVHLNTAVSALMELVNETYAYCERTRLGPFAVAPGEAAPGPDVPAGALGVVREAVEALILMLAPFTPHLAEELWESIGRAGGVTAAGWPEFDPDIARAEELELPVQVNGKVRAHLSVPLETPEAEVQRLALADPHVRARTSGQQVVRVIVVPRRLVNVVTRPAPAQRGGEH